MSDPNNEPNNSVRIADVGKPQEGGELDQGQLDQVSGGSAYVPPNAACPVCGSTESPCACV